MLAYSQTKSNQMMMMILTTNTGSRPSAARPRCCLSLLWWWRRRARVGADIKSQSSPPQCRPERLMCLRAPTSPRSGLNRRDSYRPPSWCPGGAPEGDSGGGTGSGQRERGLWWRVQRGKRRVESLCMLLRRNINYFFFFGEGSSCVSVYTVIMYVLH